MPEPTPVYYLVVALSFFIMSVGKGGLGGLLGALSTLTLTLVLPVDKTIGLLLPVLLFADIFTIGVHWHKWNLRLVGLLLPGALLGITLGTWLITSAPTDTLELVILYFPVNEARPEETWQRAP